MQRRMADPEKGADAKRTREERRMHLRHMQSEAAPKSMKEFAMQILQQMWLPVLAAILLFLILYGIFGIDKFFKKPKRI